MKKESLLKFFLKRLKLRHLLFLLAALISLAITATVIIVLLRISTLRITDASPDTQISGNDYLGIIGVLVALAAAFIGALATIMFGNSVYTTFISKKAEAKVNRHEKHIPDLYVLALSIEATEREKEGDILRAIECRIGVLYFTLKSSYASRSEIINNYQRTLNQTVRSLNSFDLINYYKRLNLTKHVIIAEIIDSTSDIHRRIIEIGQLGKGDLLKPNMERIREYIDNQLKTTIETLKSEVEIAKPEQPNDFLMHI